MVIEYVKNLIVNDPQLTGVYLIVGKIIGSVLFFPGTPLTLLAGATLGVWWGSVVSIIGNTLGAIAAFFISRYLARDYVQNKIYKKHPKIESYEKRFLANGIATVIFLRFVPLFPFNALNYVLGVTHVSNKDYILGTFLGIIPGTIAFVYFGESLTMLSPIHIALSILAIIGLTYLGKFYEKRSK